MPALTFWVVPEIARVAGLAPGIRRRRPADLQHDSRRIRTGDRRKTVAVVPTHLWGLPCDMDEIWPSPAATASAVIEDCAHALGAHISAIAGRHARETRRSSASRRSSRSTPTAADGGRPRSGRRPTRVLYRQSAPLPDAGAIKRKLWQGRVQRVVTRPQDLHLDDVPARLRLPALEPELRCVLLGEDPAARPLAARLPRALFQRAGGNWARGLEAPRPLACRSAPSRGAYGRDAASCARRARSDRAVRIGRTRFTSTARTCQRGTRSSIAACGTASTSRPARGRLHRAAALSAASRANAGRGADDADDSDPDL